MGFLDSLLGNKSKKVGNITCVPKTVYSPLKGKAMALDTVADEAFASGMMGWGLGIIPAEGKLYAPADGTVAAVFPTGHAVGMLTPCGMEILMHIGIDTVELNGKGFQVKVEAGATVKAGDLFVEFDTEFIKKSGYDTTTMVLVSNYMTLGEMETPVEGSVEVLDPLFAFN